MIYKYFSASNTPKGFVSYFDRVMDFDTASQIIYIKGGSGIGKSTLMKKVSSRATECGLTVHHIYCSSDKDSLDGVIVPDKGVAVFDATMPHIADPAYPRINGRIVDLGVFLDESRLKAHRDEVITLTKEKKEHYKTMYSLLSVMDGINSAIEDTLERDEVSIAKIVREIISNLSCEPVYPTQGFLSLIDKDGYLDKTIGIMDTRKCYQIVSGIHGVALSVVDAISHRLEPITHARYYSVLAPAMVETMGTAREIVTASRAIHGDIIYNIDNMVNIKNRHTYNILIDMRDEIIGMASGEIGKAKEAHQVIESIYKSAMDYESLDIYEEKLVTSLF